MTIDELKAYNKCTIKVEDAASIIGIGEQKLRSILQQDPDTFFGFHVLVADRKFVYIPTEPFKKLMLGECNERNTERVPDADC